jgi:hypothetical protein
MHAMHTARVYEERSDPMISGFFMQRRQPIEAGRPAKSMPIARRYILERLLNERETSATRNRLKCHADLGLVTAFAVIPFPCPCEDEPAWPTLE